MIDDFASMIDGYDQVEPSAGLSNEPLEAGWYALEVAEVLERSTTKNGVPQARVRLKVTEGPSKGRNAFVRLYMGASRVSRKDGNELARTDAEYEKARASVQAQMKGFMRALQLTTGAPVGEGVEKVFSFYNLDAWAGTNFVGRITLQAGGANAVTGQEYQAQNNLAEFHPMNDAKKGYAWLMSRQGVKGAQGAVLGSVLI